MSIPEQHSNWNSVSAKLIHRTVAERWPKSTEQDAKFKHPTSICTRVAEVYELIRLVLFKFQNCPEKHLNWTEFPQSLYTRRDQRILNKFFPQNWRGFKGFDAKSKHAINYVLLRIWNWYILALFKFLNFLEDDLRILNKSFPQNETGFEYDSSIRREIQTSHQYLYNEVLLWIVILGLFKLLNLPETHSNWTHSAAKQESQLHPAEMVQLQRQIHELH